MPEVKELVGALARAVKVMQEINILFDQVYGNKSYRRTQNLLNYERN
jgi:hypothetical protein